MKWHEIAKYKHTYAVQLRKRLNIKQLAFYPSFDQSK